VTTPAPGTKSIGLRADLPTLPTGRQAAGRRTGRRAAVSVFCYAIYKEHLYKRRQTIVEHPYGTIKRQCGFSYILTKKGIERAGADVGFMFIAYNLRRIGNILTRDRLKEYLRILVSLFLGKTHLSWLKNNRFKITFSRLSVWNTKLPGLLIPA
jgi:hypothetical protein